MCDDKDDDNCCPCCSKTCSDRCFVVTVTAQILIGIISYWALIVIPWQWWQSVLGMVNLIFLHVVFYLLCVSYYGAMMTNPGYVDPNYVPEGYRKEELEAIKMDAQNYKGQGPDEISDFYNPRYCNHCKAFKPPRSHHCRDLNACVLKMDHYCPWVYNAVGYRNHKMFLLFLFYASTALTYFLLVLTYRIYHDIRYFTGPRGTLMFSIPEVVGFMINYCITLPVTIGIMSLFFYQVSITMYNMTSIEEYTEKRFRRLARRRGIEKHFKWFFDYGRMYNLRQVMGESVWDWWKPEVPKHIQKGDGTRFKTRIYSYVPSVGGDDMAQVVVHDDDTGLFRRNQQ